MSKEGSSWTLADPRGHEWMTFFTSRIPERTPANTDSNSMNWPLRWLCLSLAQWRKYSRGLGLLHSSRKKKYRPVTSGHIVDMKWADATAHTSASLSAGLPHSGLFMARCMAHKNESTLHNYCLINWPIFYVVSEAADRLQIICQFFRGCVS